jgi:hypothetical protein
MATLVNFISDEFLKYKKEVFLVLQQGLVSNEIIQESSIKALANFIQSIEPQETKDFEPLVQPLLKAVIQLVYVIPLF